MTREEAIKLLCVEKSVIIEVDGNKGAEKILQAYDMAIETLSAKPIQTRNCDGCNIFTMAEELAMASIDACADEIVRQIKDSRVECKDCKHHHTSEMYEYCDLVAVKGRKQRVMKHCSLGERREP